MTTWREKQEQEKEQHKMQCAIKFNVVDNPKLDRCYQIAYEYGHSCGLQEVENYFADLVDLITPD